MSERTNDPIEINSAFSSTPIPKDRAAINRANAQKSTGPRTTEGKHRSSQNATTHGLTGQVTVMSSEDRRAFNDFCAALVRHYGAEGALEHQIAQSIAEDEWRLSRARVIEHNLLALGVNGPEGNVEAEHPRIKNAVAHAEVFRKNHRVFSNMTLYQTRIYRDIRHNEARLRTLQAEREKATDRAVHETQLLEEQAHSVGLSYDPAPDFPPRRGFVYASSQIARIIHRNRRLEEANKARRNRDLDEYRKQKEREKKENGD